jgi:hypothetical protein
MNWRGSARNMSTYVCLCKYPLHRRDFILLRSAIEGGCKLYIHNSMSNFHGSLLNSMFRIRGGLISLWVYKENNKLRDWKKCIYSTYPPLSSTHLWLRCSKFFNPSKKNCFGCAANRKIRNRKSQKLITTSTYITVTKQFNTYKPEAHLNKI